MNKCATSSFICQIDIFGAGMMNNWQVDLSSGQNPTNALISVLCHPVHGLLVTAVICADGDALCQQVVECVFAL